MQRVPEDKGVALPYYFSMRNALPLLTVAVLLSGPLAAQTRPAPSLDAVASVRSGRPIPGPVYEIPAFSRAVDRGTRTRGGTPGAKHWTQYARYSIEATLDPVGARVRGSEHVVYLNNSPDTLRRLAVHLRQNVFAPGSPRREPAPVTDGMRLTRVAVAGRAFRAAPAGMTESRAPSATFVVDGAVMWMVLSAPIPPHDSASLDFAWSYSPPLSPSDGRQGRESDVYFMGYWYPQLAVYDDVTGWVADPYQLEAEFYMGYADYDVRVTAPRGWIVGATGELRNADSVLSADARARLADARRTSDVVHVVTPGPDDSRALRGTRRAVAWRFMAKNVRDFVWGAGNHYVWDATRALVRGDGAAPDTVVINSFYRLHAPASAWAIGGARYTRDAVQALSNYLWPYPWPQMTSMEGVLTGGGMEYPMLTVMQPWADTLSLAGDLMHETGHMWFPMQVGSNETRYPWMDEGFTQFDAAQGMRVLYGEPRRGGRPNDSEPGQRGRYLRAAIAGNEAPLMTFGDDFPRDAYSAMYYDKTAQILASLRALLGDETFHRAFREYGRRWIGKHPYPYDFFNTIENVTGRDLAWFWTAWLYEAWPLDQAIESVSTGADSASITIQDRGLVPMPVLLTITRVDGSVQRVEVTVDAWLRGERRQTLRVLATPAIRRIEIDSDGRFPDINRRNQVWPPDR